LGKEKILKTYAVVYRAYDMAVPFKVAFVAQDEVPDWGH
jgi:hypothetical protein